MLGTLVAVGLVGVAIIAGIVHVWPSNHWSLDIRWCWVVIVPAWGYFLTVPVQDYGNRAMRRGLLMILLLVSGMLIAADAFNLLVQYEVWIQRGMPVQWEMRASMQIPY